MAKKVTKLLGKVAIDSGVILIRDGSSSKDYKKEIRETIENGEHQVFNHFKSKGKNVSAEIAVVAYSAMDGWKDVYGVFEDNILTKIEINLF